MVYTAKPEIPCPLVIGQEYRITAAFKQKVRTGEEFSGYGEIYQRINVLANARISQLTRPNEGAPLHTWVLWHGWRCLGDTRAIATAFMTIGLIRPKEGDEKPKGESAPTAEALMAPGGATLEMLAKLAPQRSDEFYNEFDFTDPSSPCADPVMLSYGESVPACEPMNFEPFVQRAERLAEFYYDFLRVQTRSRVDPFNVSGREWYCVTNPNLVAVHVHFHS